MSVLEINKNPSKRELRTFGWILPLFAVAVGAIFQWRVGAPGAARVVWIAGGALTAVYLAIPPLRRFVYLGWMYASYPIGYVVSHVILGIAFYAVFTPVGVLMRLSGKDPMTRRFDRSAASYWVEHDPHREMERYFSQY